MIRVSCGNCGAKFDTAETNAGKRTKCSNCGSPIVIPAASASAPAAAVSGPAAVAVQSAVGAQGPSSTTVVVQVQQPTGGGLIGPEPKSGLVVWLLWMLGLELQYFYLGQMGKGLIFLLINVFIWGPVIFFTCGIGFLAFIPYNIILLIDSLVVASRISKQAISPWRFF